MKQELYFVRHGQTDHNISEGNLKQDHPEDIPLNPTGRDQARAIEPLIAKLPVKTVCTSPFKRARETQQIITKNLQAEHYSMDHFGECTAQIWRELLNLRNSSLPPVDQNTRQFIERVQEGLKEALALPGPILIIAHGGVHWSICYLMGIQDYNWSIGNCGVAHFSVNERNRWVATHTL